MRKLGLLVILSALFVILSACGSDQSNNAEGDDEQQLQAIEVKIKTVPETLKPEQITTLQAKVTQGSENVDDAEEVEFEVWKKGSEDHKKVMAEQQGKGLYSIQHTFDEKGIYYAIAHVTARGMHNMPQKKLNVGNVSEEDEKAKDEEKKNHSQDEGNSEHDHGNETSGVAVHLMKKDGMLMAHLQKGENPLTEAKVRFEVWQGDSKHKYIDAKEGKKGEYSADFKPDAAGTYKVNVHYEKGDLHGHQKQELEYKK